MCCLAHKKPQQIQFCRGFLFHFVENLSPLFAVRDADRVLAAICDRQLSICCLGKSQDSFIEQLIVFQIIEA